ncbi:MAG: hypothetical protein V9E99_04810 [Microthrixaceae bacterium]
MDWSSTAHRSSGAGGTAIYPLVRGVGSVDVPEELIRAHTDGRLVLFVGTGASVDPPSSLPLFGALAAQIAGEAGHTPSAEEVAQPDVLLGRLDGKTDVHHRVQSILNASGSAPNQLHEAIIALASSTGVLRIVTTNYDRHLTEVLTQRHQSPSTTPRTSRRTRLRGSCLPSWGSEPGARQAPS